MNSSLLGIVNSEGQLWKSQRRYLLNQKLGMKHWGGEGIERIEARVNSEVRDLIKAINDDYKYKPVNPVKLFNCAISNVICSMIMSKTFNYKDEKFQRFMYLFDEGFKLFTLTGAMIFLPILKHLPGVSDACKKLTNNRDEMVLFVKKVIKEHEATLDAAEPRDLVDSYLIEVRKIESGEEKSVDTMFHGVDPRQQLEQIILDLFSAGVETLKTSLLWAVVYMLHNPDVKEKVQQELDEVVGSSRLPKIDDMQKLPYTRATLYELMRRSSVVPMGTTHSTTRLVDFFCLCTKCRSDV